ncbi:MAG: lysylphosphatidylglycerol synthase transmembrane domain-containing protein [Calditrichia bacterium]
MPSNYYCHSASGFFLYLAFDKIDLSSFLFWTSMIGSWLTIIAVSAMAVMSMFLRAWRWRILLRPVKDINYSTVFTYTMIGFMSNNILPAHAGDFLKPYLLGLKENVSGFATLATVLVERVLDGVGLIIIFCWCCHLHRCRNHCNWVVWQLARFSFC